MNPIMAGRPIALFKMSLFDSILLIILYVKKYNINIKDCKVFLFFLIFARLFLRFCYINVNTSYCFLLQRGSFEINIKLDK